MDGQEQRGQQARAGCLRALAPSSAWPRRRVRAWLGARRVRPLIRPYRRPAAAPPTAAHAARRHHQPAGCGTGPARAALGATAGASRPASPSTFQHGPPYHRHRIRRGSPCSRRPCSARCSSLSRAVGRQPAAAVGWRACPASAAAAQRSAGRTRVSRALSAALAAACEQPASHGPAIRQRLLGGHRQHAGACLGRRQHQPGGQPQQPALEYCWGRWTNGAAAWSGINAGSSDGGSSCHAHSGAAAGRHSGRADGRRAGGVAAAAHALAPGAWQRAAA